MGSKSLEWSSFRLFASSQYALICILVFCCFRCALSDNNKFSYEDHKSVTVTDTSKKLEMLWNARYEDDHLVVDSWEGDVYEMICPNRVPDPDKGTPITSVFLLLDGLLPPGKSPSRGQTAYFMHQYYEKNLSGEHNCMAIVSPDYSEYGFAGAKEIVSRIMPDLTRVLDHIGEIHTGYRLIVWSHGYGTVVTRTLFSDVLLDLHPELQEDHEKFKRTITNLYKSGLYFVVVAGPQRSLSLHQITKEPEALSLKESYGLDQEQMLKRLLLVDGTHRSLLFDSNVILVGVLGDPIVDWRVALNIQDEDEDEDDPNYLQLFETKNFGKRVERYRVVVNLAHSAKRGWPTTRKSAKHYFSLDSSSHTVAALNGKFTKAGVEVVNRYISILFRIVSDDLFRWQPRIKDHSDRVGRGTASDYVHDLPYRGYFEYVQVFNDEAEVVDTREEFHTREDEFYERDNRPPPPEMDETVRESTDRWFETRDSF